jgi:hypothetical protein
MHAKINMAGRDLAAQLDVTTGLALIPDKGHAQAFAAQAKR